MLMPQVSAVLRTSPENHVEILAVANHSHEHLKREHSNWSRRRKTREGTTTASEGMGRREGASPELVDTFFKISLQSR